MISGRGAQGDKSTSDSVWQSVSAYSAADQYVDMERTGVPERWRLSGLKGAPVSVTAATQRLATRLEKSATPASASSRCQRGHRLHHHGSHSTHLRARAHARARTLSHTQPPEDPAIVPRSHTVLHVH